MSTRKITHCWQVNNNSIVVSCPSSKGGNYLVGISKVDNSIIVAHSCPATDRGYNCWHNKAALEAFYQWHWWEKNNSLKEKYINKKIILDSKWEQIPIPGTIPEELLELWG
jgi:hypothetical protein